jgi:hypothetical protein
MLKLNSENNRRVYCSRGSVARTRHRSELCDLHAARSSVLRLLPVKDPKQLVLLTMKGFHYGRN